MKRTLGFWVALVIALTACGTACRAQQEAQWVEEVPSGLTLFAPPAESAGGDTIRVLISVVARGDQGARGDVKIAIPDGLVLVQGDTVFSVPLGRITPPREIRVRPSRPGSFGIGGVLVMSRGEESKDEVEVELPVTVRDDSIGVGRMEVTRVMSTIRGQRYRYSHNWLIPFDGPPSFTDIEFERSGSRPRTIEPVTANCPGCPADAPDTVAFVVVVSPEGRVVQSRAIGSSRKAGESAAAATAAARSALTHWRFEPARFGGHAITDWTQVFVAIRRQQ